MPISALLLSFGLSLGHWHTLSLHGQSQNVIRFLLRYLADPIWATLSSVAIFSEWAFIPSPLVRSFQPGIPERHQSPRALPHMLWITSHRHTLRLPWAVMVHVIHCQFPALGMLVIRHSFKVSVILVTSNRCG